ncbi:MAG: hypothetical protein LBJ18_01415 [Rickettsiales bacterium]|jgi:hypothetical protein|nr:hypothetical protein [Rickettsiales bacterium]
MQKQAEHFLLAVLWGLAVLLGACFWFTVRFGFNLLSAAHWEYLGNLQATKTPVNQWFYISLIIAVVVAIAGLYLLIRPKFRKIIIKNEGQRTKDEGVATPPSALVLSPSSFAPAQQEQPAQQRPPRLNLPRNNEYKPAAAPQPAPAPAPSPAPILTEENEDLREIFVLAGYTVKKPPRIGDFRPGLWAIGSDEVLYIGGIGAQPTAIAEASEKVRTLFNETLSADIQIEIRTFAIGDFQAEENVKVFESLDDLREAIPQNRELGADESEDFDAYSEYIDTVAEYFNKS